MNRFGRGRAIRVGILLAAFGGSRLLATDYPPARRGPQFDDFFGEKVPDPYRWLEEIDSPRTAKWIEAERAYTAAAFAQMPERNAIRGRLKQLWDFPRFGLPLKRGGRVFYVRNSGLQNQGVLCVVDQPGAEARVLLDPNLLSAEGTVAVTDVAPSPDGRLLSYGLAADGSDWKELHVLDVGTGKETGDVVHWVKFSDAAWTRGGGFFYARYPQPAQGEKLFAKLSGRRLCYHQLASDQSADKLVFEIPEHPDWNFTGKVTDDGRYLVITVSPAAQTQKGLYYVDLGDPAAPRVDGPLVRLLDKFDAAYDFVGNIGPRFYVRTSRDAPHGRIVAIDLGAPDAVAWRTVVPETGDSIETACLTAGKIVLATMHDVQSRLLLCGADGTAGAPMGLPGIGAVSGLSAWAEDPEVYYGFSAFLTPPSVYVRNIQGGVAAVVQSPMTPFDPSPFETREVFYLSRDGTRVPLFITARKGLKLDGATPAWLYGYGGFNISITPAYSVPAAAWLEMGGLYAQANIRGGGEYGEAWHLAGTKERKQNVFDDFIAAADFLVAQGYTRRDRLVIEGRSNGGLLIGAVINQRPDLCAVALPAVGVMDMLHYHKFTVGAGWASDYGTSADPAGFKYLLAYSPVNNAVYGGKYPAVLITTGDHDDRVFPAHSFKYAAAMQAATRTTPEERPILIRIDSNAGHGGSSGTAPVSKAIDEWADRMGFAAHFMPPGTLTLPKEPGP
jgi:prolyl oligopeptidase